MQVIKEGTFFNSQSMAASFTSSMLSVLYFRGYSITCTWAGDPAGTLKLQISNDTSDIEDDVSNWEDLTDSSVTLTGVSGQQVYNIRYVYYNKVRIVYTRSSGTGTITANYTGKT